MTLGSKTEKSKKIIKKALSRFPKERTAIAWTGGKDSTVLLHLVREVYGGRVPIRVFFNDSGVEFKEVVDFVKRLEKEWHLDLIWHKHEKKDLQKIRKEKNPLLAREVKIKAINQAVKKYSIEAFLVGIRADEHSSRAKEKAFSPRSGNMRVHPILHFTEKDIWDYINKFDVPYISLYDQGYRSLGEALFTRPVGKEASERSGRDKDKEKVMRRLRSLGYW